jgi:hypothetical protein
MKIPFIFRVFKENPVYIFPAFITSMLIIATILGIHGSSIAVYDRILDSNQSSLIAGAPRTVRSDEWYVNTPYVLSQINNRFPLKSPDIGAGQDMSVVIDVPYKDWSVLFRPQNLIFFVLPAINAFAFKWWFLSWLLIMSVYLLILQIFPRKYVLASLLGIFLCFSPFIQWWYQTITILPIAFSFLIIVFLFKLLQAQSFRKRSAYTLLTAYCIACFAFVMYPPFQIISALVAIAICAGLYFSRYNISDLWKQKHYMRIGFAILLGALPVFLYLVQHQEVIKLIQGTIYPGSRNVVAGGTNVAYMLHWPFGYLNLDGNPMSVLGSNKSEVSRFLYLGLLLVPTLIYSYIVKIPPKTKQSRYLLTGLLILFAIICLNMFLPFGDFFYKVIGLNLIPHVRLVMGLGMINIILVALAVTLPEQKNKKHNKNLPARPLVTFVYVFIISLLSILFVRHFYALVSVGSKEVMVLTGFIALIAGLLVYPTVKLRYFGLAILVVSSMALSVVVNPLYRGFGSIQDSNLARAVKKLEARDSSYWIATDQLNLEQIPLAVGAETFSIVQTYPQLQTWDRYFPGQSSIYNRYAHIKFIVNDASIKRSIKLIQADSFSVSLSSCDDLLKELRIDYIIANGNDTNKYDCFKAEESFKVGTNTVSIFTRKK